MSDTTKILRELRSLKDVLAQQIEASEKPIGTEEADPVEAYS